MNENLEMNVEAYYSLGAKKNKNKTMSVVYRLVHGNKQYNLIKPINKSSMTCGCNYLPWNSRTLPISMKYSSL